MQVFIIGSPLETAKALSPKHLNNQINEAKIILDALNGAKAWSNHPVVLQYRGHEYWLQMYMKTLHYYAVGIELVNDANEEALKYTPKFHNEEFFNQMKRRLFTKNPQHYAQWVDLGESQENWYYVDGVMRRYVNGKRID